MIIKNIEEFESINEGILKSIFSGIGKMFDSKKSNIESVLKKIEKAKREELDHTIEIEKTISELAKDNSPEYRFKTNNLERQERVYSSIKKQEVNSLIKEAMDIIKDNPKLQAFFSAQLAKIEAASAEEMIKNLKKYKDSSYMDTLNREFDQLVQDANKKTEFYKEYQEKPVYSKEDILKITDEEVREFIDMSNQESYTVLRNYNTDQLDKLKKGLNDLLFSLNMEWEKASDPIKKEMKKARKENEDWLIEILQKQERELRYYIKKPMDKIRYKLTLVEKEIRSRKYVTY